MGSARIALMVVFVVLAAGCAAPPGFVGPPTRSDEILPDQRIPISDQGSGAGKWEGPDLFVEYRYTSEPGGMAISGSLDFIDSIKYSFGLLNYFTAGIIFGDGQGRVLGSTTLLVDRQSDLKRSFGERFSRRVALPPGAAVFAFTYEGQVKEVSGGRGRADWGNATSIWHYPVKRMRVPQQEK